MATYPATYYESRYGSDALDWLGFDSDLPLISFENDGNGCAIVNYTKPPKELTLTLSGIANLIEPLCDETKKLLQPLRSLGHYDKIQIGIQSDLESFVCEVYRQYKPGDKKQPCYSPGAQPNSWQWRIPGSRIDTKGRLIAPTTDFTVILLGAMWGEERITFEDAAAQLIFQKLAIQWQLYIHTAAWQAEYKAFGTMPDLAKSFPDPVNADGSPRLDEAGQPIKAAEYQRVAAACGAAVPGYALFMKQGTGKTFVAIMVQDFLARKHKAEQIAKMAADPLYKPRPFRVLVACPKNARSNWVHEYAKFSTTRGQCHTLRGDWVERAKIFWDVVLTPDSITQEWGYDWSAMILSYGLLRRDVNKFSGTRARDNEPIWDLAILDECHNIKDVKALQSKAAIELRDSAKHRLELTGTPMPNKASEFFNQLEFLGHKNSGFQSQAQFAKYYNKVVEISEGEGGYSHKKVVGIQNTPLLQERLARMSFIITKEEALEGLPPKVFDIVGVEMSEAQTQVYEKVLRHILIEAEKELGGAADDGRNYSMVVQNVLTKMLRLSQITSGFYVASAECDDYGNVLVEKEIHRFDPNPKVEALVELIRDKPKTSKALIWCNYHETVKQIAARLQYEGKGFVTFTGKTSDKNRDIAVEKFNTDYDTQFFLGIRSAGGVAINLLGHANEFTDCDHVINVERNWSFKEEEQADDRAHRRGTRKSVRYTSLLVGGTIDEEMYDRVREKRDTSVSVQDVRDLLGRLANSIGKLRE